jgi:hypothetical protein
LCFFRLLRSCPLNHKKSYKLSERDAKTLSPVIARLGVADVRAFGLAWDDCEELLHKLGFSPRVEVVAA